MVSVGVITKHRKFRDDVYSIFINVEQFVEWIRRKIGSGFLLVSVEKIPINWKSNDAFCEYVVNKG